MEYTVSVTIESTEPVTKNRLMSVAAIGGVTVGNPGEHRLETTLTVSAPTIEQSCSIAVEQISSICPGTTVALESMTTREFDRALQAAGHPK